MTATEQRAPGTAIDNEEYHASGGVSNSQLKIFIEDPREYYYQFLSGEYVRESKACFDFGQAVHDVVLLGDKANIVGIPSSVLASNGAKSGNAWKEFAADNAGKLLLKEHEYLAVLQCADAVLSDKAAAKLLCNDGPAEHMFSYYDETLELTLRCKVDKLAMFMGGNIVVDLKTTATGTTAGKFANQIANYGYHLQAYFYGKVLSACGIDTNSFVFVAVSTTKPHTVDCYTLSDEFLQLAQVTVENALLDLAERTQANDWLPRSHGSIVELAPPNYLKFQGDFLL